MKNFLSKTKGNYSLNHKNSGFWKYLIPVLIVFVVLLVGKEFLRGFSAFIIAPVYEIRQYFAESSATIPMYIRNRTELVQEINALKQQVSAQQGTDVMMAFLRDENEELHSFFKATSSPRILAGVISRPPYSPYDTLVIDRGENDGITKNAPVYIGSGQTVGYIQTVYKNEAIVSLFSSPGVEATVYIFGPNIFATARGEGGGVVRLSVPQGVILEKDNVVILPSLDTGVVGKIAHVQSIPTEPEQYGYIASDLSLQSIRLVNIGTHPITRTSFVEALENVHEAEQSLFKIDLSQSQDGKLISTQKTASGSDDQMLEQNFQ
ncbi:MAG: hypothetical protein K9M10_01585 [Candidatus Pacebacteria bacterium]|nr:hypothetical protein [Candidatus Paceibacterota bacterium]MCF7857155.1 hypothetical protein [Candidatus Paceibacterota bacterium]